MSESEKLLWNLKTGDMDAVKAKVQTEEDANKEIDGRRLLHIAADFGQKEVVEYLISLKAGVNAPDKHGITPLLYATYEGHLSIIKTLLEKGADKNAQGPDGLSAIESTENEAVKALLK